MKTLKTLQDTAKTCSFRRITTENGSGAAERSSFTQRSTRAEVSEEELQINNTEGKLATELNNPHTMKRMAKSHVPKKIICGARGKRLVKGNKQDGVTGT